MSLDRLEKNLVRLDLIAIVLRVLDKHESDIQSLVRLQLQQGVRGDGQLISPQYTKAYAKKKKRTVPNLKVTGQFYSDIFTGIVGNVIHVDADTKAKGFELGQHLQKRYTSKILELTRDSRVKLGQLIKNDLQKAIKYEIYR